MPKVSIIVPVYNVERYIVRSMDSLVNQTLKDIEIIEENTIVYEINTDSNYYYITDSKIFVASEVL